VQRDDHRQQAGDDQKGFGERAIPFLFALSEGMSLQAAGIAL
jgi:hypothetical protein